MNAASGRKRSVRLGAFRSRRPAVVFAKSITRTALAKHRTVRVVKLVKIKGRNHNRYGVRLSGFAEREAKMVCASIKKAIPRRVLPAADES